MWPQERHRRVQDNMYHVRHLWHSQRHGIGAGGGGRGEERLVAQDLEGHWRPGGSWLPDMLYSRTEAVVISGWIMSVYVILQRSR